MKATHNAQNTQTRHEGNKRVGGVFVSVVEPKHTLSMVQGYGYNLFRFHGSF